MRKLILGDDEWPDNDIKFQAYPNLETIGIRTYHDFVVISADDIPAIIAWLKQVQEEAKK